MEQRRWYDHWERNNLIRRVSSALKDPSPEDMLSPEQEYRFFPVRFKQSVQWSITGRCNFRCKHCFMSAPHGEYGEPTWDELMSMLNAFERCGIKVISLTGGEPLIRRDFWELVEEITARGMIVSIIYTNGMLVTEEFLDKLEEHKIHPMIQFSFDGVGHHDWMRGVPGAEQKTIEAIRRCHERGLRTAATMTLFKDNAGSIRETANLLASLGCIGLKVGNTTPQGEWLDQPEHYLSQNDAFQTYLDYIPYYFEDGKPISIDLEGFFNYDIERDEGGAYLEKGIEEERFSKVLMCGHVRRDMYVDPRGFILPCMSMVGTPIEKLFPNMLEQPLEDILSTNDESLYMKITDLRVSQYMEHNEECAECDYRADCCGGCRAIAINDNQDDYLAKDPVACMYFKGGWKEKKAALLSLIPDAKKVR